MRYCSEILLFCSFEKNRDLNVFRRLRTNIEGEWVKTRGSAEELIDSICPEYSRESFCCNAPL